jgi:hypothetical protein
MKYLKMVKGGKMKIRIIAVPPGQAPEEIRKGWIGCEFETVALPGSKDYVQLGVRLGKPENLGGYNVETGEAIAVLAKKNPNAAEWWKKNFPPNLFPYLVFKKEVCEEI